MEESLRPCFFCGEKTHELLLGTWKGEMIHCDRCVRTLEISPKKYNDAYCWKQIDSLQSENARLKEEIMGCGNHLDPKFANLAGKEIQQLRREKEKLISEINARQKELHEKEAIREKLEKEKERLIEFIKEEAGFDCSNEALWNKKPCGACASCRARKVLSDLREGEE